MPSLADVQSSFADALLAGDAAAIAAAVAGDGLAPEARVAIHRHHVFTSLTAALRATYPVIARLVGGGFFGHAAHEFIAGHPPSGPCLFEYGGDLARFLESFPACRELGYLPDVARLEWALNESRHAEDVAPLDLSALRSIGPAHLERLAFRFDPSMRLVASPYPIDRIWRANQPDADPEATVDVTSDPVRLEVRRLGNDVVFGRLDAGAYAFRRALGEGHGLAVAARTAEAAAGTFDLAAALHALFMDGVLTGFRLDCPTGQVP